MHTKHGSMQHNMQQHGHVDKNSGSEPPQSAEALMIRAPISQPTFALEHATNIHYFQPFKSFSFGSFWLIIVVRLLGAAYKTQTAVGCAPCLTLDCDHALREAEGSPWLVCCLCAEDQCVSTYVYVHWYIHMQKGKILEIFAGWHFHCVCGIQ